MFRAILFKKINKYIHQIRNVVFQCVFFFSCNTSVSRNEVEFSPNDI